MHFLPDHHLFITENARQYKFAISKRNDRRSKRERMGTVNFSAIAKKVLLFFPRKRNLEYTIRKIENSGGEYE
jgi:hypothetical protein